MVFLGVRNPGEIVPEVVFWSRGREMWRACSSCLGENSTFCKSCYSKDVCERTEHVFGVDNRLCGSDRRASAPRKLVLGGRVSVCYLSGSIGLELELGF